MARETVLVVDDEKDILELIRYNLEREGYSVHSVTSGEAALVEADRLQPDLVVLDLMLPGMDGLEVCRRLRRNEVTHRIALLMLTAKSEDADVVTGLEVGADDYLTKPFSPRVLIARIRAVLRRREEDTNTDQGAETVSVHGITIDTVRHQVFVNETAVELSASEFAILEFLARHPGWVFSREKIIDAVHGKDYPVTERSVDVQILGLRKRLGGHGQFVQTVRGVGYRLQSD